MLLDLLDARYVQIDQFLSQDALHQLLAYVTRHEADFVPTTTSTGEMDYRRSRVLYSLGELTESFIHQLQAQLPEILPQLGLTPFPVSQIEIQLTAHNDGDYYKIHNDNGSPEAATRELTYVYYFHQEPQAFSGGELRLYNSRVKAGYYQAADSYQLVTPRNNSLVFFPSRCLHEVLPVCCPAQTFAHSRFTINGWIRR